MNEPETVNVETNRLLDLLERRISLLESLGMALQAANTDIVRFDISGLERRIHDQERLCDELQRLNSDIESVQVRCVERVREKENSAQGDPSEQKVFALVARLGQTQTKVRHLNEQHRELLRRSRRTVNALVNSFQNFTITYSNPAVSVSLSEEGCRR